MASVNTFKALCLDQVNKRIYYARNGAIYLKTIGSSIQTIVCGAPGQAGYAESVNDSASVRFSSSVTSLCLDRQGALIVVDSGNHCVRKINLNDGSFVSSLCIAGIPQQSGNDGDNTIATESRLNSPTFARVNSNNVLYISDTNNYLIRRIGATGKLETVAGRGTNQPGGDSLLDTTEANSRNYTLFEPRGLAFDSMDTLYITDSAPNVNKVYKIPTDGIIKPVCGGFTNSAATNIANMNSAETFDAFNYYINTPYGLVFDSKMDLFVTSKSNNQILKLTNLSYPRPQLSVICGIANNTVGTYRLYEQAAKYAELNMPTDIDFLVSNNTVYFIDEGNFRIRSIIPEEKDVYSNGDTGILPYGMLTAIANVDQISQTSGGNIAMTQGFYAGLIQRDDLGNIYYVDSTEGKLYIIMIDNGMILQLLSNLTDVKYFCIFDSYYVYFITGNTLKVYNSKEKILKPFTTESGTFLSLCAHPGGTMFIGMPGRIKAINLKDSPNSTNTVSCPQAPTLTDYYISGTDQFTGMCVDNENNLYVIKGGNSILKFNVIYKACGSPDLVSRPVATFTPNPARSITSIAFNPKDPGNIYYSCVTPGYVGVYSLNKLFPAGSQGILVAGTGISGNYTNEIPSVISNLKYPESILFNYKGELLIADKISLNPLSTTILKARYRQFMLPNCIYNVIGFGKKDQTQSSSTLSNLKAIYSDTNAVSVAFDEDKNIFLAELDKIRKIDMATGIVTRLEFNTTTPIAFSRISDVKVGTGGILYITDTNLKRVYRATKTDTPYRYDIFPFAGNNTTTITPGNALNSGMNPTTLALDSAGNVYIFCSDQNQILKIDFFGILSVFAGVGGSSTSTGDNGPAIAAGLNYPIGGVFTANGDLIFSDTNGHRVRKIAANGTIQTIAGTGVSGYGGDGGPATAALLNSPGFIALDSTGTIYIADQNNHRIRKIDRAGVITTAAGNGAPEFAGTQTNVAGFSGDGGLALEAQISNPYALSMDSSNRLLILQKNPIRLRIVPFQISGATICGITVRSIGIEPAYLGKKIGFTELTAYNGQTLINLNGTVTATSAQPTIVSNPERRVLTPGNTTKYVSLPSDSYPKWHIRLDADTTFTSLAFKSDILDFVGSTIKLYDADDKIITTRFINESVLRTEGQTIYFVPPWLYSSCNLPITAQVSCGIKDVRYVVVNGPDSQRISLNKQLIISQIVVLNKAGENVALGKYTTHSAMNGDILASITPSEKDMWPTDGYYGQAGRLLTSTYDDGASEYIKIDLGELNTQEIVGVILYNILVPDERQRFDRISVKLYDKYNRLLSTKTLGYPGVADYTNRIQYDFFDFRSAISEYGCSTLPDVLATYKSQTAEVFAVGNGYTFTKAQAIAFAAKCGYRLATYTEMLEAFSHGMDVCFTGWLADKDYPVYPINDSLENGCGSGSIGILPYTPPSGLAAMYLYGLKPTTQTLSDGNTRESVGWFNFKRGRKTMAVPLTQKYVRYVRVRPKFRPYVDPEVFYLNEQNNWYNLSKADATNIAAGLGMRLATFSDMINAVHCGAQWCNTGWVDGQTDALYPMTWYNNGWCGGVWNNGVNETVVKFSDIQSGNANIGRIRQLAPTIQDTDTIAVAIAKLNAVTTGFNSSTEKADLIADMTRNNIRGINPGLRIYTPTAANMNVYGVKKRPGQTYVFGNRTFVTGQFDTNQYNTDTPTSWEDARPIFSQHQINLSQIAVLSAETGENLAIRDGVTISASVSGNNSTVPRNLISGDYCKRNQLQGYISDQNDSDPWVEIDLGKEYLIDSVQLYLPKSIQTGNYIVEGYTEKRVLVPIDGDPLPNPMRIYPVNEILGNDSGSFQNTIGIASMSYQNNFADPTLGMTFQNNWIITLNSFSSGTTGVFCRFIIPNLTMKYGNIYTIKALVATPTITSGTTTVMASASSTGFPESSSIYDFATITSSLKPVTLRVRCAEVNGGAYLVFKTTATLSGSGYTIRIANLEITEELQQNPITKIYGQPIVGTPRVRYMRIEGSGLSGALLHFSNIRVVDVDGVNVALNKPVSSPVSYITVTDPTFSSIFSNITDPAQLEPSNFILTGPWTTNNPAIIKIDKLTTGELVFISKEQQFTKMVSRSGVAKFYVGEVSNFSAANWSTYSSAIQNGVYTYILQMKMAYNSNTVDVNTNWWQVDLGGEYEIKSVILYNMLGSLNIMNRIKDASVVLIDKNGAQIRRKQLKGGVEIETVDFRALNGVKGVRYVKLSNVTIQWAYLVMSQLAVFDKYRGNVAIGKTATSSSVWNGSNNAQPRNAVNGDMMPRENDLIFHTGVSNPSEWFQVDLGEEFEVTGVTYINRLSTSQLPWSAGVSVQLLSSSNTVLATKSLRGNLYREDLDFTDPNTPAISPMISKRILADPYVANCVRARYVRIENPGLPLIGSQIFGTIGDYSKYRLYINEFKLYDTKGREITTGSTVRFKRFGDAVATEGTLESKAPLPLKTGNTDTYISSPIPGSWWEVDLGKEYNICSLLYKHKDWTTNPAPADADFIRKSMKNIPIKFYSANREENGVIFVNNNSPTFSGFYKDLVGPPYPIPSGTQGIGARFVRIQVDKGSANQLQIQQIVAIDSRGINVALGRRTYSGEKYPNFDTNDYSYSATNTTTNGNQAIPIANQERHVLCNGKFDNFYLSIRNSTNYTGNSSLVSLSFAWVEIDLGDLYDLTAIHYYGANTVDTFRINIILYDNNHVKVPLNTATNLGALRTSFQTIDLPIPSGITSQPSYYKLDLRTNSNSTAPTELVPNKQLGKKARYVRIEAPTPTWLVLSQISVIDCLGRNVTLNKRVSGTKSAGNDFLLQNCVNGINEPFYKGITHTYSSNINQYIEIDLEDEYYIVDIYTMLRSSRSPGDWVSTIENSKIILLDSFRIRTEVYTFTTTNNTRYTITNPGTYSDKVPPTTDCDSRFVFDGTNCVAKCGAYNTNAENFRTEIDGVCYSDCPTGKALYPGDSKKCRIEYCPPLYIARDDINKDYCVFDCQNSRVKDPNGKPYEFRIMGGNVEDWYCRTTKPFSGDDFASDYYEYTYTPDTSNDCFPGFATVFILTNTNSTKEIRIDTLKIGDKILTINEKGELEFSEMFIWGHQNSDNVVIYYKITTESNNIIYLSEKHYLYIDKNGKNLCIEAENVKLGDLLYIYKEGEIIKSKITTISLIEDKGLYAPFTISGNLIVNSIFANCYSNGKVLLPKTHTFLDLFAKSSSNYPYIYHLPILSFYRLVCFFYGKEIFTKLFMPYEKTGWANISIMKLLYTLFIIGIQNLYSCVSQTRLKISIQLRV